MMLFFFHFHMMIVCAFFVLAYVVYIENLDTFHRRILIDQRITVHMPLLMTHSTFGLGKGYTSSPQRCYIHFMGPQVSDLYFACLHT